MPACHVSGVDSVRMPDLTVAVVLFATAGTDRVALIVIRLDAGVSVAFGRIAKPREFLPRTPSAVYIFPLL